MIRTRLSKRRRPKTRPVLRVGLVGCTKSKVPHRSRAEVLYSASALFRGRREYVRGTCDRWFVLSAKHGLLSPSAELDPYDVTLVGASLRTKRAWAERVLRHLVDELGELSETTFEIHAGSDYWAHGLEEDLRRAGATVEIPARGLTQGQQLRFYLDHVRAVTRRLGR